MATTRSQRGPVTATLSRALQLLPLVWIALAGARTLLVSADATTPSHVNPNHGRRLEQAALTLPACKTQLTTCKTQLGTCKAQLTTAAVTRRACATKLAACTQSATVKQLSACQRRGAAYNGRAASTGTKLQLCNTAKATLAQENRKLKAASTSAKRAAVVAVAAAEPDPLTSCQQLVAALQAQVDSLNITLAGTQAALNATQLELDSVNAALVQRDADVAALQEQLATASEQLQQYGEELSQLESVRWQLSQLWQVYNVTDGLLNQTRDDLDRVSAQVEGLQVANATCHADLTNLGARLEDTQAEVAACQLTASECAGERASLQEAYLEAAAKQFPPAEYVACANELITLQIANETASNEAGECKSRLEDVERSYQECMSRNRRLLKLPGGRPALSRTTA